MKFISSVTVCVYVDENHLNSVIIEQPHQLLGVARYCLVKLGDNNYLLIDLSH